ncbi:MAG TPA: PAS domain S-box protein [Burkholderiales bacterium]|jgi:PAS domain S-box-containing protein|nr:PAS domain S-box protein [Burkholderiales bacterium]
MALTTDRTPLAVRLSIVLMVVSSVGLALLVIAETNWKASDIGFAAAALAVAVTALGSGLLLRGIYSMQQSAEARRQSEEQFHQLVAGVTDYAIYMLDREGRITTWNLGAERIKGYPAAEIVGQNFSTFFTPEDRAAGVPARALETAAREGRYEAESVRIRKDGTRFWANVVLNALYDASGRLRGFAKVTRDITERRHRQESLEQAQAQLVQAQKMEGLGQLTGGIAHDFNNLLTVIQGSIDLIERRVRAGDQNVARYIEAARRGVDRAASLTQGLLAFARRQPLEPQPLDPNKLVASMAELLRRTLGEGIAIRSVLAGELWWVSVDRNQLESAILNIAINARDAMPDGGKLTIETANSYLDERYGAANEEVAPGEYVLIALSDTGRGMPADALHKVFEPFYTTKQEGTGLGLSQVYGFVKQSNGHVKIYSEPGHGTTVKIYLPKLEGVVAPEVARVERPLRGSTRQETILVVEDDADLRGFTMEMLHELGYRVLGAGDARSALQGLEEEPAVDLLFTDVALPNGVNGRQLADEAVRMRPAIRVLYTTGYARNAIVHHGRLDPGVELLPKPYTQPDLARRVREVLDRN